MQKQIYNTAYLYGYDFPLDPSKTVISLTLNTNNNAISIFAMDLSHIRAEAASANAAGNLAATMSAVTVASAPAYFAIDSTGNVSYDVPSQEVSSVVTSNAEAVSAVAINGQPGVFVVDGYGSVEFYQETNRVWNQSIVAPNPNAGATSISGISVGTTPQVFALNGVGNIYTYPGMSWSQTLLGRGVARSVISMAPGSNGFEYFEFEKDDEGNVYCYGASNGQLTQVGGVVGVSVTAISAVSAASTTNNYHSVFVINSASNVYDLVYNSTSGSWGGVGGIVGSDAMLIAPISSTWVLVVDASGDIHDYNTVGAPGSHL